MEDAKNRVGSFSTKPGWYAKKKGRLAPQKLADSGFFYEGTSANPKRITCFLCRESLDEVSADTDPFDNHAEEHPDCPRVLLYLHHRKWIESSGSEHLEFAVNSERIIEARLATFKAGWPNTDPNWTCTPKKLAEAGFCFRPNAEATDYAECLCCNLGLDGWEKDDDPVFEHRKRSPNCLFFRFPPEPKSKKETKAAQPSPAKAEVEEPADDPAPKTKAPRKKGGRKEKKAVVEEDLEEDIAAVESQEPAEPEEVAESQAAVDEEPVEEPAPRAAPKKAKGKAKRGKAAAKQEAEEDIAEAAIDVENDNSGSVNKAEPAAFEDKEPAAAKRKREKKAGKAKEQSQQDTAEAMEIVEEIQAEIGKEAATASATLRKLSLNNKPGAATAAPAPAPRPAAKPTLRTLTEEELDMTVEELLRSMILKEKETLETEGKGLVDSWKAKVDLIRGLLADA